MGSIEPRICIELSLVLPAFTARSRRSWSTVLMVFSELHPWLSCEARGCARSVKGCCRNRGGGWLSVAAWNR